MKRPKFQVNPVLAFSVLSTVNVLLWSPPVLALDPSLDVSQYAHTAWRISEGFATGEIQHLAQTPDGYLWVATEFGLLRFDGVRTVPWEPPAREHLPSNDINSLIAARGGTLWIGTAKGLVSWKNGNLTHYPQLDNHFVAALLEDHEGTVWAAGVVWETAFSGPGKLCAIKGDAIQCYGTDGSFGFGVTALYEDSRSNLWLGAGNGLWRWRPRPSIHYMPPGLDQFANPGLVFPPGSLLEGDHGALLIGGRNGIKQLVDGKLQDYPLPSATLPLNNAAPLLRDRNGGLWIGTRDVGLLHVHQGRMDVFAQSDGLSGNNIRSLFEDREGSIWVATTSGLDRFREYAIPTITVEQGLSSHFVVCVLAAKDGSVWLGTGDGLNRWKEGRITVYRRPSGGAAPERIDTAASQGRREEVYRIPSAKQPVPMAHEVISSALPDNHVTSLFQDAHGRIWVSTIRGLAYFENDRLVRLKDVQVTSLSPITGDSTGSLWVTNNSGGLYRLSGGRVTGHFPWAKLGIRGSFSAPLVTDPVNGGLWLGSWSGGVIYFKDGQVRASYGPAEGLGAGRVNSVQLDSNGALWAATDGGLSRIKNGRVITLTSKNGLPCDTAHDVLEDDAHTFWVRMACGLVRIPQAELDAWVHDPQRMVKGTVFDTSDGVRSHSGVYQYGPRVAKTADGRLWFLPLVGVMVVDPHYLPSNQLPPPVHIEQITADGRVYTPAAGNGRLRLPPLVHDLTIDFAGLSFVAPEKVHFRFKLQGQDEDWREVVNDRKVQYSNLAPRSYRFLVKACNNSGVWNQEGAFVDFVIVPAWYQTNWFRALCAAAFLGLLWAAYQVRIRQLQEQERKFREAVETMPALAFIARPDGYRTFVNQRWVEYTGLTEEQAMGSGWEAVVHPDDLKNIIDLRRTSVASGEPVEYEARLRRGAEGEYRWFQMRLAPLWDKRGNPVKWCGVATDIEDRKRAEQALRGLNRELRAISNCNQTVLRATNEQSLLKEICRIACEEAGYRMAWVGYAEHDEVKSVRPAAWTGAEEGYLTNLGLTWADTEHGHGPTGTAIRTGKTCCIQDFAADARIAPWRENALLRDFRSGIALPLKDEQANAFGSLSIYSAQPNAFTPEEIRLLEELATDLAFGIVTLRSRAARERAEEALREGETRFRTFVDNAADALFIYDFEQGTIVDVNRQACESLGYARQELIGTTPLAFDQNVDRAITELIAERTAAGETVIDRHWHRRKNGTLCPVEVHTSQYWYGGRRFLLKVARDISDRLRAEEQREKLRQLEADLAHINRVSMMGELTASIAHEVNQPLSGVVSNGSACLRWLAGDAPNLEEAREASRRIVRDGKRAGEVIARVRALVKRAATPSEKLDLNEIIREVLALVGDEAKRKSVSIRTQFADDLSPIAGDRVQLQQVVLNLVMNAIEAMSSVDDRPRELLITTRNIDADQVQVTVKDSGTGIDPNTLDKIFDPFYTTKPGGMGMGLSISRSILQAHGGRLWAAAKDGPGTIFHFSLPKYHDEESNAAA